MLIILLAFIACCIPSVAIYLWLKNRMVDDQGYRDTCRKSLIYGLICAFPVILASALLSILGNVTGISRTAPLVADAYRCFIVLALAEEGTKCLALRRVLKDSQRNCSWLEMAAFMIIVGIGFGLAENVPYALTSGPGQMVVRGITVGHGSYGFVMGYLMGKGEARSSKAWTALGFLVPWLMHGLYDYSLSESMAAFDASAFIAVGLALADLAIIVAMILFMRKARSNEKYTLPLR